MRILYFGTSPFAVPALEALVTAAETVVGVVTQPDRPAGRGGRLSPSAVKEAALARALPVLQPESCRAPAFLDTARALAPDLIVVAAYGQFLPDPLLALPAHGAVNLHGSRLPAWRGAAPIQRAIWAGDPVAGVCLMWMVRAMDAGDVIACADTPIDPLDTAGTLGARLAALGADLLCAWLPALARDAAPHHPQDPDRVTLAPPIRKEERAVAWADSAEAIARQIRALAPAPAATTLFRGQPVKLLLARAAAGTGTPGTILAERADGLFVAAGSGAVEILTLQPAGKRPMPGRDFLRGVRPQPGEGFSEGQP
jgi:methionyl-tRNA formyltransferase